LLPHFLKWSRGIKLDVDDVELRTKENVPFTPKGPLGSEKDVDAISSYFFFAVKNKSGMQFRKGKGVKVHILLPLDKYMEVMDLIEANESLLVNLPFCLVFDNLAVQPSH
jgi:hypothetical protein